MDSKGYFLIPHEKLEHVRELSRKSLNNEERRTLERFCSVTESVDEIYQLYCAFRINLALLIDNYILGYDDRIVSCQTGDPIDFYMVNTLTANIVSSGKNTIERIKVLIEEDVPEIWEDFRIQYYSKVFDKNLSYRFLNDTRNITQHGHFIVSRDPDGRYAFDVRQILDLPHYTHNRRCRETLEKYQGLFEEVSGICGRGSRIGYTYTLDKYCVGLTNIYYGYYSLTRKFVRELTKEAVKICELHQELVIKKTDTGRKRDILYCDILDDDIHAVEIDIDFCGKFRKYRNEAYDDMMYFQNGSCAELHGKGGITIR